MAENDLLHDFEAWAAAITSRLSPSACRAINRDLARALRRSQQQRIAQQQNPDGSVWEPRRRLRRKHGRIKRRKMYMKLRTAKHMKIVATPDAAIVKFSGRDARIARIAQYGLTDRVSPGGPSVRYPRRELLGFTESDRELVRDMLMDSLVDATA